VITGSQLLKSDFGILTRRFSNGVVKKLVDIERALEHVPHLGVILVNSDQVDLESAKKQMTM
jgi:hypothetical protein